MYRMMNLIRRVEIASDLQYKSRKIRGFLHLYDGQACRYFFPFCCRVGAMLTYASHQYYTGGRRDWYRSLCSQGGSLHHCLS